VRRALLSLVVLALVLAVAAGAFVTWTVRRSFPQRDGVVSLPGLGGRVTVYRDEHGVPQLWADSADDLFLAQGYVHAQDRFWEMDFRRHVTAGRLSELFGPDQLDTDRFVRTLGWRRVAEQELPLLDDRTREYLQAYADGVNAYLAGRSGSQLSLEHGLLALTNRSYRVERWTPADSVAWLKAMAWDLRSNLDEEYQRADLARKRGRDVVDQLWPGYPYGDHPTILPSAALPVATPQPAARAVPTWSQLAALRAVHDAVDGLPELLGPHGSGLGSNSWVVAGSHTASGRPLLANDPHLGPSLPSVWTQMGLHCREVDAGCPFDVAGFTFSGMPGVVIGHNAHIAWGFTNLAPDVADLYLEKVDRDSYEYRGQQLPLQVRTETIRVAGEEPRRLRIRTTRHGPLLSDVSKGYRRLGQGDAVALRWTALTPGRTMDALFAMDRATGWDEMRAAAELFEVPAQNIVYADTTGHIGYQAPGRIPVRSSGDGRWPARGWTGEQEWTGYVPFDQLPSSLDPAEGYVVTANNAVVPPAYPVFLTDDWDSGYRADRIAELVAGLAARGDVTADDLSRVQGDTRNPMAPVLVPALQRVRAPERARDAARLLTDWDHQQQADSAAAAYYNAVWKNLLRVVFHDQLPKSAWPEGDGRWMQVVTGLLGDPTSTWWDDTTTARVETRDDALRTALGAAYDDLADRLGDDPSDWRWGSLHALPMESPTFGQSGIAPVEKLVNRGLLDVGGGESTVDATGWSATGGYRTDWIPSMRMVVDLADLDRSTWVLHAGASGHAFHENYTDQADLWRDNARVPWPFTEPVVRHAAEHTLVLEPGGAD
jgi:penicillin amidase